MTSEAQVFFMFCFEGCYMFSVLEFSTFYLFLINLFIYYFLAALGFVAAQAFCSCGEQGLLFVAVRGLLIVVASLAAEHGL